MSYEVNALNESATASGDLSLCQNRVVQYLSNAPYKVGLATTNAGMGVLTNAPRDGENANVAIGGVAMVRVGAAVQYGDLLTSVTSGWALVAAVTAGKQHAFGRALGSVASGMLAPVRLFELYLPNSIA